MPRYIDLAGGLGVLYVGRGNQEVLDAVNVQVDAYVPDVAERAREQARIIWERLRPLEDAFGSVGAVRLLGPMVDLEMVVDERTMEPNEPAAAAVVHRCYQNGVLVLKAGTHDNVVRILAPLVISEADLHEGLEVLTDALEWANKGMPAT